MSLKNPWNWIKGWDRVYTGPSYDIALTGGEQLALSYGPLPEMYVINRYRKYRGYKTNPVITKYYDFLNKAVWRGFTKDFRPQPNIWDNPELHPLAYRKKIKKHKILTPKGLPKKTKKRHRRKFIDELYF